MKIIHPNSLAATLDVLNEIFFMGRSLSKGERNEAAEWIASRQGLKGAYSRMFAPTELDFKRGIRLFTGEKVFSGAAIGHILGEESSRALILLGSNSPVAGLALNRATTGMMQAITRSEKPGKVRGFYCCGTCTAALWRNLAVGGLKQPKKRLAVGLEVLRKYRDGNGKWRRFPFYYTLLALSEIDDKRAIDEIRYVAPVGERLLGRYKANNKLAVRRRILLQRILAKC